MRAYAVWRCVTTGWAKHVSQFRVGLGEQLVGLCGCRYDTGTGIDFQVWHYDEEEVAGEAVKKLYKTTRA